MSNYKNFFSQFKRKSPDSPSSGSDADSPISVKPVKKKLNIEEEATDSMDSQLSNFMSDISKRLDSLQSSQSSLATKDDISKMEKNFKEEIDNLTATFVKKIDSLEERVLKVEGERDKLREEITAARNTNADLFKQLNKQEQEMVWLRKSNNDAEQQGRKWNIRVFNIPESEEPEPGPACIKKCCKIFTDMVGVPVQEEDIEVAHRIGTRLRNQTKNRPMIVRFFSRKKKDELLSKRRQLKGKKISIGEDLTSANYKLLKLAKEHSATMDAWSSNGKVIAKLKNGKTVRVDIDKELNATLRREM